jgi:hypothetical protein
MHDVSTPNNFTEFCPWAENNINISHIPVSCWAKSISMEQQSSSKLRSSSAFYATKRFITMFTKASIVPLLNQINQVHTILSPLYDLKTPSNLAMKQCKIKFPTVVFQVLTINRLQRCTLLNSTQKVRLQSTVTMKQNILNLHNIYSVYDEVSYN